MFMLESYFPKLHYWCLIFLYKAKYYVLQAKATGGILSCKTWSIIFILNTFFELKVFLRTKPMNQGLWISNQWDECFKISNYTACMRINQLYCASTIQLFCYLIKLIHSDTADKGDTLTRHLAACHKGGIQFWHQYILNHSIKISCLHLQGSSLAANRRSKLTCDMRTGSEANKLHALGFEAN